MNITRILPTHLASKNANMTQGLVIQQGTADDEILALKSSDVAHGLTTVTETDTYALAKKISATLGGLQLIGLSDGDGAGLELRGVIGASNPTDTVPAVIVNGYKSNGTTGVAALGVDETVFQVQNNGVGLAKISGGGAVTLSPASNVYGADFYLVKNPESYNVPMITIRNSNTAVQNHRMYFNLQTYDYTGSTLLTNTLQVENGTLSLALSDSTTVPSFMVFNQTVNSATTWNGPALNIWNDSSTANNWAGLSFANTGHSRGGLWCKAVDIANTYGDLALVTRAADGYVARLYITSPGNIGAGTTVPDRLFHAEVSDAVTNAVTYAQRLSHITSGTAAAGFGTGIEAELEDDGGTNRVASYIETVWNSAATAAYKADLVLKAVDSGGTREGLRIRGSGTAAAIGFLGATPYAQIAHVADASTAHNITDPADAPADADALREDLVTNVIPSIESALNALGTKINNLLTMAESFGFHATA